MDLNNISAWYSFIVAASFWILIMNLILVAAFIAACSAAKLDRTYLPPASSQSAGGSPTSGFFGNNGVNPPIGLQTPFERTIDNKPSQGNQIPSGSYENDHQGIVVDAALPGTRASNQPSGLGGPRVNYGSTDSKVGDAAFRGTKNQPEATTYQSGNSYQTQFGSYQPLDIVEPDLSGFYQPTGQTPTSSLRPDIQIFRDRVSNTIKFHNNMGLDKFNYGFETENGIVMMEKGVSNGGVMTEGGYSYKGDDGKVYSLVYTADKEGFRPVGSHLPTPPPIPAEIMESLEQNAKDEANGIFDDGSYDAQKYNAEDDNAQSDTNGDYNDRQSNRFGERPEYATDTSAFINQVQQGFVRPNIQGQFNNYDSSNSKESSTRPDTFKFGTSVGGFDNTKQYNKFREQIGSNTGADLFTYQGQQVFVRPNSQGQFSSYDFSNSKGSSIKPDSSKFGTDISGFDNTKPNNVFGEQIGSNTGASTFANQAQQEFIRPISQGQFSSNDFSNLKDSSTQSDTTKFGAGLSGFDNTKQTFGVQVGSNSDKGTLTNQGQQSFVRPNAQGQFSSYDFSKGSLSTQPDITQFGAGVSVFDNVFNKGNSLTQNGQNPQLNNGFGSQFQYLPPLGNVQDTKPIQDTDSSKNSVNNIIINAQPLSEHKLQDQGSFEEPFSTLISPNSFGSSNSGQKSSNNQQTPSRGGSNTFGTNISPQNNINFPARIQSSIGSDLVFEISDNAQKYSNGSLSTHPSQGINYNSPQSQGSILQTGLQSSLVGPDLGLDINDNNQNSPAVYDKGPLSLPTPFLNIGLTNAQEKVNNIPKNQGSSFQSSLQSSGDSNDENINVNLSNKFSSSIFTQSVPTKQPELTLTTPLENEDKKSDSFSSELGASFIDSQPLKPDSINFGNSQNFLSNNQKPFNGQLISNIFTEQSQGPNGSYNYNKPLKPFNSPFTQPDLNKPSGVLFSQFNAITQPSGTLSPNAPEGPVFSTQYQGLTESTKYPQPTLSIPTPTLDTFDVDENNTFQTNGITQASISAFPFITPTSPSQTHSGEIYEYTKPAQGLPTSSQEENISDLPTSSQEENNSEPNSEIIQQSSLPSTQKEDPIKPQINVQANTQFGQRFSTPSTSLFSQQTTPSRFDVQSGKPTAQFAVQGTSSFEQKNTPQQSGSQSNISSGQQTKPPPFNTQTSTSHLNQKTTPTNFGVQTSSIFGQKPSILPFGAQTSTSLNLKTKPLQFGAQTNFNPFGQQTIPGSGALTSTILGQKPTQGQLGGQTSFPFGSQTPSRFGVQKINQQTTQSPFGIPLRFGDQINLTFGQTPNQQQSSGQTSLTFGSQVTPSRFGAHTGTSFNQQTKPFDIPSRFGILTGSTLEPKPTQSQVGGETSFLFGQKPTQQQSSAQTSFSFSSQTTPSIFGLPTSTSFGQQTTSSRLGTTSSAIEQSLTSTPFYEQTDTLEQKLIPSRFNVQTGSVSREQTTPTPFVVQKISPTGQQTTLSPFNVQTSSTFGQKLKPSQFDDSSPEDQSTLQFGNKPQQNEKFAGPEQQTQFQESQTQSESKPSNLQPITSMLQNSQETVKTTKGDEIYQYNKPSTSFTTNTGNSVSLNFGSQQSQGNKQLSIQSTDLNKEYEPFGGQFVVQSNKQYGNSQLTQFGSKPNNQLGLQTESTSSENKLTFNQQPQEGTHFDELPVLQFEKENFSTSTKNEDAGQLNQQSQVAISERFPELQTVTSSIFASQKPTQSIVSTSSLEESSSEESSAEESSDSKETTNSQFPSTNPDNPQINSQSTFNLHKQDQLQKSQSDEVYQYNNPSQTLPVSSETANNRFGENTQFTGQPAKNKLDITKPITSHLSQISDKIDNTQLQTQIPAGSPSSTDSKIQSTSTQGTLLSSKSSNSRPQLSFHSACCSGFKTQNGQGSFPGKVPSDTRFNGNFGSSNFAFSKNDNQAGSALKDNKFGNQGSGSGIQNQNNAPSFIGKGEQFGGPRNPPKFDETGYHY